MRVDWIIEPLPSYPEEPLSGLDMAIMKLFGNRGEFSSDNPRYKVMSAIAACDLLGGVRQFLSDKSMKKYKYVGADSSLIIYFEKKKNISRISVGKDLISEETGTELAEGVFDSAKRFFEQYRADMAPNDGAWQDFSRSLEQFKSFLQSLKS